MKFYMDTVQYTPIHTSTRTHTFVHTLHYLVLHLPDSADTSVNLLETPSSFQIDSGQYSHGSLVLMPAPPVLVLSVSS